MIIKLPDLSGKRFGLLFASIQIGIDNAVITAVISPWIAPNKIEGKNQEAHGK